MNKRLHELRKSLEMSQEKFGEKLGVTKAGISKIESGERNLTETMIKLICTTYNVNEIWLRTGVGDMTTIDQENELAWMIGALHAQNDPFKKRFITEMLKLNDDQWEEIHKFINKLAGVED